MINVIKFATGSQEHINKMFHVFLNSTYTPVVLQDFITTINERSINEVLCFSQDNSSLKGSPKNTNKSSVGGLFAI